MFKILEILVTAAKSESWPDHYVNSRHVHFSSSCVLISNSCIGNTFFFHTFLLPTFLCLCVCVCARVYTLSTMAAPVDAATRKRVLKVIFISLLLDLVSISITRSPE